MFDVERKIKKEKKDKREKKDKKGKKEKKCKKDKKDKMSGKVICGPLDAVSGLPDAEAQSIEVDAAPDEQAPNTGPGRFLRDSAVCIDIEHQNVSQPCQESELRSNCSTDEDDGEPEVTGKVGSNEQRVDGKVLNLFVNGEFCCCVQAICILTNKAAPSLEENLQINHRAKVDTCKWNVDASGGAAKVWRFLPVSAGEEEKYNALGIHLVEKQRVGIVTMSSSFLFVIPPDAAMMKQLGLAVSDETLIGLQVTIGNCTS